MNWLAAGIAALIGILIAATIVGYVQLGNWIYDRWGIAWSVFYGIAAPLALYLAILAGVSIP